jgi:DNA polymerase-3 subunit delta'
MVDGERLPHALLILSSTGSGDLPLALALSQYILCENRSDGEACGNCPHCIKASRLIHPDIHYSFPTIGTNVVSDDQVSEWRAAVLENPYFDVTQWLKTIGAENKQGNINARECANILKKLSFKTFEGRYKILIMWLPEYLGKEGNRLLKLIEEPPDNTIIILVSQNPELILNTIISRCQIIKLNRLSDEDITQGLQAGKLLEYDKALSIALLSDGNFSEALKIAENAENDQSGVFLDWLRKCYEGNGATISMWADRFATRGRESHKQFLQYGLHFLRELTNFKICGNGKIRLLPHELDTARKLDRFLGYNQIGQLVKLFDECSFYIERNANQKLLFLDASIKVNRIFKQTNGS